MGFLTVLTLIAFISYQSIVIAFKLIEYITWSWEWVLAPIWVVGLFIIIAFIVLMLLGAAGMIRY